MIGSWATHRAWDYLLAPLVAATYAAIAARGHDPVAALSEDSWGVLLQTFAGVAGAFTALALSAVAIIFAVTPGPRLRAVLTEVGQDLAVSLLSNLAGQAMGALGCALLIIARPGPGEALVFVLLAALVVLRTARLLWLFKLILTVLAGDSATVPLTLQEGWKPPSTDPADYAQPVRRPRRRRASASQ